MVASWRVCGPPPALQPYRLQSTSLWRSSHLPLLWHGYLHLSFSFWLIRRAEGIEFLEYTASSTPRTPKRLLQAVARRASAFVRKVTRVACALLRCFRSRHLFARVRAGRTYVVTNRDISRYADGTLPPSCHLGLSRVQSALLIYLLYAQSCSLTR
jgi:hypothetical protein